MRRIEVITTGTELLRGSTTNADLAILGRVLAETGAGIACSYVAGDSAEELLCAFSRAAEQADVILVTGGLGSTGDDVTREAAALFFGQTLVESPEVRGWLHYCWKNRHPDERPPRRYFRQAQVFAGGGTLANEVGSAPGLTFHASFGGREIDVYLLPGPPRELEPMARQHLLPRLAGEGGIFTCGFLAAGIGELGVEEEVLALELPPEIEAAYCASPAGCRVFFSGPDAAMPARELARLRERLARPLPECGELELALVLLRVLRERSLTLGVAESCTGGLLGAELCAVPGASSVFMGGVIAYDNRIKCSLLGVPESLLAQSGAVSAACAEAMARGALCALGVQCSIAVTGIAGPDGGTPEKPVGLVYIGTCVGDDCRVRECRFRGDRAAVREQAAAKALLFLYEHIHALREIETI